MRSDSGGNACTATAVPGADDELTGGRVSPGPEARGSVFRSDVRSSSLVCSAPPRVTTGWGWVTAGAGGGEEGPLPTRSLTPCRGQQVSGGADPTAPRGFVTPPNPPPTPNSYFGDFTPRPFRPTGDGKATELSRSALGPWSPARFGISLFLMQPKVLPEAQIIWPFLNYS